MKSKGLSLLFLVASCGGQATDESPGPGGESTTRTGGEPPTNGEGPTEGGGSSSGGGGAAAVAGGAPAIGSGGAGGDPGSDDWLRLEVFAAPVDPQISDDGSVYLFPALPENSRVFASLDNVEINTSVWASLVFLLDECSWFEPAVGTCRVAVPSFAGLASGSPDTPPPLDLRLADFSWQTEYYGTAMMSGDGSWSASFSPEGLILDVGRWEGAVLEETYDGDQLTFIRVAEEERLDYQLPVYGIEVECTSTECSVVVQAGASIEWLD